MFAGLWKNAWNHPLTLAFPPLPRKLSRASGQENPKARVVKATIGFSFFLI
jgi:hypothetical protein